MLQEANIIRCLARRNLRPRNDVTLEIWAVDVRRVPAIRRLHVARNLHAWAERFGAATRNLDLGAGDVELRRRSWVVNAELLDAEEVFARCNARRDRGRVRC